MEKAAVPVILLLAGFLVLMVLAAGCTEMSEDTCKALSGRDRDHCYQNIAKITGNLATCNKIEGSGPVSKCYAYVAGLNREVGTCMKMDEMPWHRDTEAYRPADCVLYVARTNNCPGLCDFMEDYRGGATDLNPGITVTASYCRQSIKCGNPGQPACRSMNGPGVFADGESGAYYCMVENMSIYSQAAKTC